MRTKWIVGRMYFCWLLQVGEAEDFLIVIRRIVGLAWFFLAGLSTTATIILNYLFCFSLNLLGPFLYGGLTIETNKQTTLSNANGADNIRAPPSAILPILFHFFPHFVRRNKYLEVSYI